MIVLERLTQKVYPGKWMELEALDKKYSELEAKMGFPAKSRYQCIAGGNDQNTLVIQRQWPSMAVMEAAYEKALADPAYQALLAETLPILQSNQIELLTPLP